MSGKSAYRENICEFSDFTEFFSFQSRACFVEQSEKDTVLKIKPRPEVINKEPHKNIFYFIQKHSTKSVQFWDPYINYKVFCVCYPKNLNKLSKPFKVNYRLFLTLLG